MEDNPLRKLQAFGQSVWLDYLDRNMIDSGELGRLIENDGVRGVTSNPAIFDKAISGSDAYDDDIRKLARQGKTIEEIYEAVTVKDVQLAADLFRGMYEDSAGRHGYVSLEVNPHLAHDETCTINEARRLWHELQRPNTFIKVPGTKEGLAAVRQLIADGVNINITLLFGLPRYREVTDAYIAGLEERAGVSLPLDVASVASFFLSRIDMFIDPLLEEIFSNGGERGKMAAGLRGEIALAGAKQAYAIYQEIFGSERFTKLVAKGAHSQRVLWASTGNKNPEYSETRYIEPLVGPDTVNTMPKKTLDIYRRQGNPANELAKGVDQARQIHWDLAELGIDIDKITQQLEEEGIEKFIKPYDATKETLRQKIIRTAVAVT